MENLDKVLNTKKSSKKSWLIAIILIALIGIGVYFMFFNNTNKNITYITKKVKDGNLELVVSQTGNIEPTITVSVGTEVSGTIDKIYVDYNSVVKKGQILATLDKTDYEMALQKAKDNLKIAESDVLKAKAALETAEIALSTNKKTFERDKKLRKVSNGRLPSEQDYDADESSYLQSKANVKSAKADLASANASLSVAKTNLKSAQYDLTKTVIYSPINGVVLDRGVDEGQTVAATYSTPELFTIAKDLREMQLEVSIDEMDIAKLEVGQLSKFTVSAYDERKFKAYIKQVRLNSENDDGVVTYTAVLDVNNSDLTLKPGMTADVDIVYKEVKDALIIPRSALLYTPTTNDKKAKKSSNVSTSDDRKAVYLLKDNQPVKVFVTVLGLNGVNSAVKSDELKDGDEVVLATQEEK